MLSYFWESLCEIYDHWWSVMTCDSACLEFHSIYSQIDFAPHCMDIWEVTLQQAWILPEARRNCCHNLSKRCSSRERGCWLRGTDCMLFSVNFFQQRKVWLALVNNTLYIPVLSVDTAYEFFLAVKCIHQYTWWRCLSFSDQIIWKGAVEYCIVCSVCLTGYSLLFIWFSY